MLKYTESVVENYQINDLGVAVMATFTEMGTLIVQSSDIRNNSPRIADTGVTVKRIVYWYKLGYSPEEIADRIDHLSLAQVFAALTFYHLNQEQIESEISNDEAEAEQLERKNYSTEINHS